MGATAPARRARDAPVAVRSWPAAVLIAGTAARADRNAASPHFGQRQHAGASTSLLRAARPLSRARCLSACSTATRSWAS